jgi:transcriptional regulator with XRE-family HTH domain
MLTRSQFATWLRARRDAGETLAAIGNRFGVSHVTVTHWLSGHRNPSRMALALAGELCRAPMEMAAGLPTSPELLKCLRAPEREPIRCGLFGGCGR